MATLLTTSRDICLFGKDSQIFYLCLDLEKTLSIVQYSCWQPCAMLRCDFTKAGLMSSKMLVGAHSMAWKEMSVPYRGPPKWLVSFWCPSEAKPKRVPTTKDTLKWATVSLADARNTPLPLCVVSLFLVASVFVFVVVVVCVCVCMCVCVVVALEDEFNGYDGNQGGLSPVQCSFSSEGIWRKHIQAGFRYEVCPADGFPSIVLWFMVALDAVSCFFVQCCVAFACICNMGTQDWDAVLINPKTLQCKRDLLTFANVGLRSNIGIYETNVAVPQIGMHCAQMYIKHGMHTKTG